MLSGPRAAARLPECLNRLRHRGPDDLGIWAEGDLALGFVRLAINGDGSVGHQPFEYKVLVGAFNGEIYNYRQLVQCFVLQEEVHCDTAVLLPLYEKLGERIIDVIDGFYSGILFDKSSGRLLSLRDAMGKKPLLVGRSGSEVFVTSELKVFDEVQSFEILPKGVSRVDLRTGAVELLRPHRSFQSHCGNLRKLVVDAVRKRLPSNDEPVGLFLSGGLDSSVVAAVASGMRGDIRYYTLVSEDSPDWRFVMRMVEALGLDELRTVPLPSDAQLPGLLEQVVEATESFNPSIVSNGLCTWLLAEAAHEDGLKVVLTGEGADELFCGYHRFRADDPWRETRRQLVEDMHFTELRRLDTCSMAHAVEVRCPFLDRAVRSCADALEYEDHYELGAEGVQNKMALRRAFRDRLPREVLERTKTSFDVGSGVRSRVVRYLRSRGRTERAALKELWCRHFNFDPCHPYFHEYPVFDDAIEQRGATHR